MLSFRNLKLRRRFCASLVMGFAWTLCLMVVAQAGDLKLKAQLVWATDSEKPKDANYKEVDSRLRQKLGRVFKWKKYFEISQQKVSLTSGDAKRLKMSSRCEIELKSLDEYTLEIRLFGEGKLTKTLRQSTKALVQGELSVLAGDAKDNANDAWFVVISVPE